MRDRIWPLDRIAAWLRKYDSPGSARRPTPLERQYYARSDLAQAGGQTHGFSLLDSMRAVATIARLSTHMKRIETEQGAQKVWSAG